MRILIIVMTVLLGGCAVGEDQPLPVGDPISLDAVPMQFDDRRVETFAIDESQWGEIARHFEPPASADPEQERQAIRIAMARFEQIAGEQLPTHGDGRKNRGRGSGQMDCTDESTNTTTALRLLRQHDLLRWHRVMNKAFRGLLEFDTHWTAQVQDTTTGVIYVVDSWYLASGERPFVQPTAEWKRKRPFPADQVAEVVDREALRGLP
jgi:hypothetical protein